MPREVMKAYVPKYVRVLREQRENAKNQMTPYEQELGDSGNEKLSLSQKKAPAEAGSVKLLTNLDFKRKLE